MTGTSVPPDFRLPWNTTHTMADAWRVSDDPPRTGITRPRAVREPAQAKVPFAGKEATFVLRDWQGSYLHQSCEGFTPDAKLAWRGSERQLQHVRQRFPSTADLIASEVA